MAWVAPKTDWAAADVPIADDFNRAEGNTYEIELGTRTLDDDVAIGESYQTEGALRGLIDVFCTQLKNIIGLPSWIGAPTTNLYKQNREWHVSGNFIGDLATDENAVVQRVRIVLADDEALSIRRSSWDMQHANARVKIQANSGTAHQPATSAGYDDDQNLQLIYNSTGSDLAVNVVVYAVSTGMGMFDDPIDVVGAGWCFVLAVIP